MVAGAGFAGLAASLAAARNGVNVILAERYGFLGGTATAGLVHHFNPVNIIEATGIAKEIYNELKKRGTLKEFPAEKFEIPFSYWQGARDSILKRTYSQENVKTEVATLATVGTTYGVPLGEGVVDYDKQYPKMKTALEKAGIQKND